MAIGPFQGEYRWLSNFWPARVELDEQVFHTVEHAYQAAKTLKPHERLDIVMCPTPGAAKAAGRKLTLRPDWDSVKLHIMFDLVLQKFWNNLELRAKLIATDGEELIELNTWGDRYWGVCNGVGQNHLGKILMQVRDEIIVHLHESALRDQPEL